MLLDSLHRSHPLASDTSVVYSAFPGGLSGTLCVLTPEIFTESAFFIVVMMPFKEALNIVLHHFPCVPSLAWSSSWSPPAHPPHAPSFLELNFQKLSFWLRQKSCSEMCSKVFQRILLTSPTWGLWFILKEQLLQTRVPSKPTLPFLQDRSASQSYSSHPWLPESILSITEEEPLLTEPKSFCCDTICMFWEDSYLAKLNTRKTRD